MRQTRLRTLDDLPKLTSSLPLAGSGSGYLCGIFHSLVQPGGTVLGIDHLDGLVTMARRNLMNDPSTAPALCDDQDSPVDPKVPNSKTMQVIKADGRMGAPKEFLPHGGWQVSRTFAAMRRVLASQPLFALIPAIARLRNLQAGDPRWRRGSPSPATSHRPGAFLWLFQLASPSSARR